MKLRGTQLNALLGLASVAAVLWPAEVRAEPTFWDGVRDPSVMRAHALWRLAEQARDAVEPEYWSREIGMRTSEDAAIKIELAGGTQLAHAQLHFLFGDCLVTAGPPHDERGREVLLQAIGSYPNSAYVSMAWAQIGIAAKRSGDRLAEYEAYSRALEVEWNSAYRAELYLRRGQAAMLLRDLPKAIFDFRATLAETSVREYRALAEWALAVALDRNYDLPAALPHVRAASIARFGSAGTLTALDLDWFDLEPKHEVHYYRALAQLAEARQATEESDFAGALQAAQLLFLAYTKAAPADDPWAPRAKEHLERLRAEVASLLVEE